MPISCRGTLSVPLSLVVVASQADITRLLHAVDEGRPGAMDELMEVVYADLERVAEKHLSARFGRALCGVTLEPAALVNESFLRLIRQHSRYGNRNHFFAIATRVMMRVLADYQRRRNAAKRGGAGERITLYLDSHPDPAGGASREQVIEVEALLEALERLAVLDPRKADVVRLRVVGGEGMQEIADSLGVSLATVERDWAFSKAWLARETAGGRPSEDLPRFHEGR